MYSFIQSYTSSINLISFHYMYHQWIIKQQNLHEILVCTSEKDKISSFYIFQNFYNFMQYGSDIPFPWQSHLAKGHIRVEDLPWSILSLKEHNIKQDVVLMNSMWDYLIELDITPMPWTQKTSSGIEFNKSHYQLTQFSLLVKTTRCDQ